MTIDSFDIVFYTAIFVLPGFLINNIIDTLNPSQKKSEGVLLLKSILYSIIHCSLLVEIHREVTNRKTQFRTSACRS